MIKRKWLEELGIASTDLMIPQSGRRQITPFLAMRCADVHQHVPALRIYTCD